MKRYGILILLCLAVMAGCSSRKPQRIAFLRFEGDEMIDENASIWVTDEKGLKEEKICGGGWPDISPDGKLIAAIKKEKSSGSSGKSTAGAYRYKVIIVDAASKNIKPVDTIPKGGVSDLKWSPDSQKLAFKYNDNIGIVDKNGENFREIRIRSVSGNTRDLAWNSDGKSFLCREQNNLLEVDLNGKVVRTHNIERIAGKNLPSNFSRSKDGKYMVYQALVLSPLPQVRMRGLTTEAVFVYDMEKEKRTRISPVALSAFRPKWSSNGKDIVFEGITIKDFGDKNPQEVRNIYIISNDGSNMKFVSRGGSYPSCAALEP